MPFGGINAKKAVRCNPEMAELTTLAIIPARAGSKGIRNKNIAQVEGKPLIFYSIFEALHSKNINRVIVSTDSKEIAAIAENFGADVPFLRPPELARDDTPGIVPILHAVRWLEEHENFRPDFVMCLQPSCPLRTREDIDNAVRIAIEKNADAVVSVTPVKHHPYWMKVVDEEGQMTNFVCLEQPITRRQDLPPIYALNGAIYLARWEVLLERQTWYTEHTYAYIMPPERSLDIDTPWDLYLADLILRDRVKRESR